MSPSVSENFRFGKRHQKSAHMRSPSVNTVPADDRLIGTLAGASSVVIADFDDEPRWQQRTTSSSLHAENSGSHWPEWMLGMPSASGFSLKVTACTPLAA